jgi:hypothetical protein
VYSVRPTFCGIKKENGGTRAIETIPLFGSALPQF